MRRAALFSALALCLLCSCAAPTAETSAPTAAVTPAPEPTPAPTPEPTEDPFAWMEDREQTGVYASMDGLEHMPLDSLPQEVLDSLELVEESGFDGFYPDEWGCWRRYVGPGLELTTTAPSETYMENLRRSFEESGSYYNLEESCTTPEEFAAYIAGEEDREWITWAAVTDDSFATQKGLKVGMTVEEAEKLGYPLQEAYAFGAGFSPALSVTVEKGQVTSLSIFWDMGRYIGKFWEM